MQVLWDICAVLYLAAYLLAGVRYASLLLPREGRLVRISAWGSLHKCGCPPCFRL